MNPSKNQAAWLHKARNPLEVGDAPIPVAGPGEIVVKNAAVAINPLDWHMQESGVFVQQWPTTFGCDIAGEVFEVGPDVDRFKEGDRIIGHAILSLHVALTDQMTTDTPSILLLADHQTERTLSIR